MKYRATKQADGTYTIHDVEIFAECVREFDPLDNDYVPRVVVVDGKRQWAEPPPEIERMVFDAAWMREVVKFHASANRLPSIHVDDRALDDDGSFLGSADSLRVVEGRQDGKARLICNLICIPERLFKQIDQYKHCSVELADNKRPEILSLALLRGNPYPLHKLDSSQPLVSLQVQP